MIMADSNETFPYDDNSPLYSSWIHSIYIQYLKKHYPEIDINELLTYAGMTIDQVQNQGHWFNQVQADRFHEKLVELTKRHDISRIVGQYITEARLGHLKVFAYGFLSEHLFLALKRIIPKGSRAVATYTKRLGGNKVEIIIKPKPGVNEKRYQCENRTGSFESAGKIFSGELAEIEHPKCFHDGDDCCQYIVTIDKQPHMIWKDILKISFLVLIMALPFLYFFLPTTLWRIIAIISILCVFLISHLAVSKEKKHLSSVIDFQRHAAEDRLEESLYAPDISFLFKSINEIGAENISSPRKIITNTLKQLQSRFLFDFGAIMLLENEKQPIYMDSYGEKRERKTSNYLQLSEFSEFSTAVPKKPIDLFENHPLDNVEEKGKSYRIENKKGMPFSQYFKEAGVNSLFFFPMLFGQEVLGALLVGYYDSNKKISKTYENTFNYFATQIAAVLTHSMLYEELADKESQHRLLMANLKGMVFRYHLDENKSIDFISDGCLELTGLQPESISSFGSFEQLLHPDNKDQYFSIINKINKDSKEYEVEYRIITVTGEEKWVWEKGKAIVKNPDSIILEGFIMDITEKKTVENVKNEFIDRTSHELRTPLHDIMLNASPFLELRTYSKNLSETAKKKIKRILQTANTMNQTVDDLLNLSKLENKKIITNLEKLPLIKIVNDSIAQLRSHIKDKGHELRIDIDKGIIVDVDKNQMQIVINNLLINAIKYTPSNGIIKIVSEKNNGFIRIKMIDNGYGIPPEYQQKIFNEFFKIKTKEREAIRGSGLGLAIARKIINNHNGRIYCESPIKKNAFPDLSLGGDCKGSIFVIELNENKGNGTRQRDL